MNEKGFIIFGWGYTTTKNYGPTIPIKCSNCNNKVYYYFIKKTEWFTLFFIPIFPLKINDYLLCPICQSGWKLNFEGVELAKNLNDLTNKFSSKEISSNKYFNKANKIYSKLLKEGIKINEND